jgi:DNA-directed RNA polymerase subunit N (RpoN/RPB10)
MDINWMDFVEIRCRTCGKPLAYAYKNALTNVGRENDRPTIHCLACCAR